MATPERAARYGRAITLIIVAVSVFAVVDTIAKLLLREAYPVLQVVWARYTFQVVAMLVLLGPRLGWRGLVATKHPGAHVVRGVVLTASSLLFFSALAHITLAAAASIAFLAPILVTAAAAIFLHERVRPATWFALAAGLGGVVLIVRPGSSVFTWWALLPLGSACCFASYQLLTRRLAGRDSAYTALFFPGVIGMIVMTPFAAATAMIPDSALHALGFVAVGVLGGVGHYILIKAFERAPASTLAPFSYTQIASVLVLGWFVFGEFPDALALAGTGVIVLSGLFLAWRQRRPGPPLRGT